MKNCIKCTSPISDDSKFCEFCGAEQPRRNILYCSNCGAKLDPESECCPGCGKPVASTGAIYGKRKTVPLLIASLSKRIFFNALIWMCIGCLQLLLGLYLLYYEAVMHVNIPNGPVAMFIYFIFGVLNIVVSSRQFKYRRTIQSDFSNLYKPNRFGGTAFLFYIYNAIIIFSGFSTGNPFMITFALLGTAALISDIVGIKTFVYKNKSSLLELENSYKASVVKDGQDGTLDVEPDNRFFNIYADFTLDQLKDILEHPDSYNKDAYAVAKILYDKKVQSSPQ